MTVHLPKDIESSIEAAVDNGRFASIDDALAEAWRVFQQQRPATQFARGLGSIGALRDSAEELDEIVANAMKRRQEEVWRDVSIE